jgi:hypothetical protein
MKLNLKRRESRGGATIGSLYIDGVFACYTLEDEVREIEGEPVSAWKIKGATAIPSGQYAVTLEDSARFGPDTLTVNDVPGFVAIRMHAGNTAADTEGCPLLGMAVTMAGIVGGTSRPAVNLVKGHVLAAIGRGEDVAIDVSNAVAQA